MVAVADSHRSAQAGERSPRRAGARLLLIEDDPGLARLIRRKLREHQFTLELVTSLRDATRAYDRQRADLVMIDLDLADGCGSQAISYFRSRAAVPIIALSSRRAERDTVAALERGADDYLAKPIGLDELEARIRVALRHVAQPATGAEPILRVGGMELDLAQRSIARDGRPVHLTPTEYELLKFFVTHPDRFLSDRQLIDAVWGPSWEGGEHILHVYVARLRRKLEDDLAAPKYLLTESGLGYRFATDGA
ncbi:MAG: response regulator transcription factor [Chloroflexi bacterium]|nr:response regulator transcription factor [Chloroflexota bacterium]